MDLKAEIEAAKQRELDANENALAQCFPPPPRLSEEAKIPARPASVAAFICWQQDQRVPRQVIVEVLSAISALHVAAAVGDPVPAPIVSSTLGSSIDPPRSWKKEDKAFFATLPLYAQEIIATREQDREVHLRRCQNELAELKKRLPDGAAKPVTTTEKETING